MKRRLPRPAGAVLLAATLLAGCGSASPQPAPAPAPVPAADASRAELEALFRERTSTTRSRFTEADVRFVTDMIAHHAQALVMADMVGERSSNAAVQTLATRIRGGQEDEIALMQQWLRERGQPVPDPSDPHAAHGSRHGAHGAHTSHDPGMPGMLSAEQLAELERANGADFDRLFLANMIEHHRGAIIMVDALFAADGAAQDPATFRLASDIRADQAAEIGRMQRLLADMLGAAGSR